MKTIHKYALGPTDRQTVDIPTGFRVRHVGPQRPTSATLEGVMVWVEVDDSKPTVATTFQIVPTGGVVPPAGIYCGTAVMGDGFIWHVYLIGTAG